MKISKRKILTTFIVIALILISLAFVLPQKSVSVFAAGGPTIEITTSKTDIKANATGNDAQFTITATVKNNTGSDMFNAQVCLTFDTNVFEYVSFVKSTDIGKSEYMASGSDPASGKIAMFADNNFNPISNTTWKVGSFLMKLKDGASVTESSSIEVVEEDTLICDYDTMDSIDRTVSGGTISMKVTNPSNACDITELKINGTTLTASGTTFTTTVPYSIKTLNSGNTSVKVSAGAKHSFTSAALNGIGPSNENSFTITVTAEDNTTKKPYTVKVVRTVGETVKTLSTLTLKKDSATILDKTSADLGTAGTYAVSGNISFADKDKLRVEFTKNGTFSTAEILLDGTKKGNTITASTLQGFNLGAISAGSHTVTIKVLPQDSTGTSGSTGPANEYKITFVVEGAQTDCTLKSLSLQIVGGDPVNFAEEFAPTTLTYSASVPKGTAKVLVKAEANGTLATVTGTGEYTVPNSIKVTVTSQNGATTDYTIIVTERRDTSGVNIENVKAWGIKSDNSEVELEIKSTSVDTYYTISIPFTLDIVKYKISADNNTDYDVQGINVAYSINKEDGFKKHEVNFVKNNVAEKTIIYDIFYESNVATLKTLTSDGQPIDISSGSNYSVQVETNKENVVVSAEATDSRATVEIVVAKDGATASYNTQNVTLEPGFNVIIIKVTSSSGGAVGVYTLTVERKQSGAKTLQSLICGEEQITVDDNTKIYEVNVGQNIDKLKITAGAVEGATVTIEYADVDETVMNTDSEKTIKLNSGSNVVLVKVTAADGSVGVYTLNVNREMSSGSNTMPYVVAIVVISLVAVLVIIALVVVIVVNRRRA